MTGETKICKICHETRPKDYFKQRSLTCKRCSNRKKSVACRKRVAKRRHHANTVGQNCVKCGVHKASADFPERKLTLRSGVETSYRLKTCTACGGYQAPAKGGEKWEAYLEICRINRKERESAKQKKREEREAYIETCRINREAKEPEKPEKREKWEAYLEKCRVSREAKESAKQKKREEWEAYIEKCRVNREAKKQKGREEWEAYLEACRAIREAKESAKQAHLEECRIAREAKLAKRGRSKMEATRARTLAQKLKTEAVERSRRLQYEELRAAQAVMAEQQRQETRVIRKLATAEVKSDKWEKYLERCRAVREAKEAVRQEKKARREQERQELKHRWKKAHVTEFVTQSSPISCAAGNGSSKMAEIIQMANTRSKTRHGRHVYWDMKLPASFHRSIRLSDSKVVTFESYYRTSGETIQKTLQVLEDLDEATIQSDELQQCQQDAMGLLQDLIEKRQGHTYIESSWEKGCLKVHVVTSRTTKEAQEAPASMGEEVVV